MTDYRDLDILKIMPKKNTELKYAHCICCLDYLYRGIIRNKNNETLCLSCAITARVVCGSCAVNGILAKYHGKC